MATQLLIARREWDSAFALANEMGSTEDVTQVLEAELDGLLTAGRLATLEEHAAIARARGPVPGIVHLIDAEVSFRRGESERARAERGSGRRLPWDRELYVLSRTLFRAAQAAYFLDTTLEVAIELGRRADEAAEVAADVANANWIRYLAAAELER